MSRLEFSVSEDEFKVFMSKLLQFGKLQSGYTPEEFAIVLGWASDALKQQMGIANLMFDQSDRPTREGMN